MSRVMVPVDGLVSWGWGGGATSTPVCPDVCDVQK